MPPNNALSRTSYISEREVYVFNLRISKLFAWFFLPINIICFKNFVLPPSLQTLCLGLFFFLNIFLLGLWEYCRAHILLSKIGKIVLCSFLLHVFYRRRCTSNQPWESSSTPKIKWACYWKEAVWFRFWCSTLSLVGKISSCVCRRPSWTLRTIPSSHFSMVA